jgi:hypothetical protein
MAIAAKPYLKQQERRRYILKDAYYFSHDSNAKDDPKCTMLIEQLGLEGYGIYWVLIETLRDQPEYRYPLKLVPALARKYNTTAEKMKTVIMGYDLFEVSNDEFFSSDSLNRRMGDFERRREIAILAGRRSAEKRLMLNDRSTDVQHAFNDRSAVKESKVKERKVNKINIFADYAANDVDLRKALSDFETMRKSIKKPMTDRAREMLLSELDRLASDSQTKVAILNQSILHNWLSVFPLKTEKESRLEQKRKGEAPATFDAEEFMNFTMQQQYGEAIKK